MKKYWILSICLLLVISVMTGCGAGDETTVPGTAPSTAPSAPSVPSTTVPATSAPPVAGPVAVDWSMTAHLTAADGTTAGSFPITIQGSILDQDGTAYLSLDIALPDDFRYSFDDPEPNGVPTIPGMDLMGGDPGDLSTSIFTYDAEENAPCPCNFVINAELGYFLAYWREEGSYLVAATDPDVKAADVIEHFRLYFDAWDIPAGE